MLPLLLAPLHALLFCLPICHRYSVMTDKCWDINPDKRATFLQLKKTTDHLVAVSLKDKSPYMDLNFVVQQQLQGECDGRQGGVTFCRHGAALIWSLMCYNVLLCASIYSTLLLSLSHTHTLCWAHFCIQYSRGLLHCPAHCT